MVRGQWANAELEADKLILKESLNHLKPGAPLPARRLQSNLLRGGFVHDRLSNGRSYKMLTVLDEFTRQALAVNCCL